MTDGGNEAYREARAILADALRDRAPATAEAFDEETIALSDAENAVAFALASLLAIVDWGNGPQPEEAREQDQRADAAAPEPERRFFGGQVQGTEDGRPLLFVQGLEAAASYAERQRNVVVHCDYLPDGIRAIEYKGETS